MLLRELKLNTLRNLSSVTLEPGERFNVFAGDNGQGKTNLLEAIYIAGTLRSFRTSRLADAVAIGSEAAYVRAHVERSGLSRIYEVTIGQRSRRVRLDGKTVRPISRYFGDFNVVLFAPEDLSVPRGAPADRRRFLDRAVFNRSRGFLEHSQAYDKAVRSRNALLRELDGRAGSSGELLDVYDEQIARHGCQVMVERWALLDEMRPRFAEAFESITRTGMGVELRYVMPEELDVGPGQQLLEAFALALKGARRKDLARGTTSVGPHRHDVEFRLAGQPAQTFASQGQLRAMVLAWKTAELDSLATTHGDPPVLLLDDVSSELDATRNEYLFEFLRQRSNQCFITTTHPKHVLLDGDRWDYEVCSGSVTRQNKA